jgi:hypothetical protein
MVGLKMAVRDSKVVLGEKSETDRVAAKKRLDSIEGRSEK